MANNKYLIRQLKTAQQKLAKAKAELKRTLKDEVLFKAELADCRRLAALAKTAELKMRLRETAEELRDDVEQLKFEVEDSRKDIARLEKEVIEIRAAHQ